MLCLFTNPIMYGHLTECCGQTYTGQASHVVVGRLIYGRIFLVSSIGYYNASLLVKLAALQSHNGAGRSSGGIAPTHTGLDHPINPAQQMHLQFGIVLFQPEVPNWSSLGLFCSNQRSTIGPQTGCAILSVGKYIYKIPWCLSERVSYLVTAGFL